MSFKLAILLRSTPLLHIVPPQRILQHSSGIVNVQEILVTLLALKSDRNSETLYQPPNHEAPLTLGKDPAISLLPMVTTSSLLQTPIHPLGKSHYSVLSCPPSRQNLYRSTAQLVIKQK